MPITLTEDPSNLGTGTYTTTESENIVGQMIDGMLAPLTSDIPTKNENLWGTLGTAGVVTVLASIFTRKRVDEGKEPIAGFIL